MQIRSNSFARGIYFIFALGLFSLTFILPIVLYKTPFYVHFVVSSSKLVIEKLPASSVYYALFVSFLWFAIVFITMTWPIIRPYKTFPRKWSARIAFICFFIFSFVGIIAGILHDLFIISAGIDAFIYQLSLLPLVAITISVFLLKEHSFKRVSNLFIYITIFLDFFFFAFIPLLLGRIYPVIASMIVITFVFYYTSTFNKKTIALLIFSFMALFFFAQPLKTTLRYYFQGTYHKITFHTFVANNGNLIKISVASNLLQKEALGSTLILVHKRKVFIEKIQQEEHFDPNFKHLRFDFILNRLPLMLHLGITQMANRLNHLTEFTEVIKKTPKEINYLYGKTYRPFLYILFPRLLFPNKPYDMTGQRFGHRYGILWPSDKTTSINLPVLIEGWINFGLPGVLMSALIFGLALRFIWLYFIGEKGHIGNAILSVLILYTAINAESSLFLMLSGFFHTLIIYWPLDIFVRFLDRQFMQR